MKVVKKESEQQIFYSYEDFEREYSNLLTLFNAVEFSHNKIQITSQQREEKDVFDLINQIEDVFLFSLLRSELYLIMRKFNCIK